MRYLLLIIAFVSSAAWAGGGSVVDNGGDTVRCRVASVERSFALDYLLTAPTSLSESQMESFQRLTDRRAGIEALIGHAKQGGQLGRSKMKSDRTTLSSGFAAILGFNARQLIRHLRGEEIKPMPIG